MFDVTSRRWLVLSLVFFGIVISYIDRGNLSIAAPSIMREFRVTPGAMGVLLSAFFWTYGAFQIPAGAFVDRLGIRRAYAGGFLIWSIASASIALSRGTADIIAMRMVLGFAESIGPLASLSFIRSNFAAKDQGLPTSIYIAGQSIGSALGALVGTNLLDHFGWRTMFAMTGLGALFWLPCWWFAVPSDGARRVTRDAETRGNWTWRSLLRDRSFWALSLCILLSSYYWYFVLTWVPSYLVLSKGFSNIGMGHIISTALFTMAASNVVAGYGADRLAARMGVFRSRLLFATTGYAGNGEYPAASGCAGPGVGPACAHLFDLRCRHGQFQFLGNRAACASGESDRADCRVSQHSVSDRRHCGADRYGMDVGATEAIRARDSCRRSMSGTRERVPDCDGGKRARSNESASCGGLTAERIVRFQHNPHRAPTRQIEWKGVFTNRAN